MCVLDALFGERHEFAPCWAHAIGIRNIVHDLCYHIC